MRLISNSELVNFENSPPKVSLEHNVINVYLCHKQPKFLMFNK